MKILKRHDYETSELWMFSFNNILVVLWLLILFVEQDINIDNISSITTILPY